MSLIDPSLFPVLQAEQAETAAQLLRQMGRGVDTHTTNANTEWQRLIPCYRAPEGGHVNLLLKPAVEASQDVKAAMDAAAGVMERYARELASLKARLDTLRGEANAFRTEVFNTDFYANYHSDGKWNNPIYWNLPPVIHNWDQWPPTVERNNELLVSAAQIMSDLSEIESLCGQEIVNLLSPSRRPQTDPGESVFPVYDPEQFLNSPVPWGQPQKRKYTDWIDNFYSTTHDWLGNTAGSIAGFAGVEWDWPPGFSPSLARDSWYGLGMLGIGAHLASMYPVTILYASQHDDFFSRCVNLYVASVGGIMGFDYQAQLDGEDPWQAWDDPQAASTNTIYNIVSLIFGAKTASLKTAPLDVVTNGGPLIPAPDPGQTAPGPPTVPPAPTDPPAPITGTTSTTTPEAEDDSDLGTSTTPPPQGPPTGTTVPTPTTSASLSSSGASASTTTTSIPAG